MGRIISHGNPFIISDSEARILRLYRQGLSGREVAAILGYKSRNSIKSMLSTAVEKEQLLAIHDKRESGETSLSKARGKVRMEGTK